MTYDDIMNIAIKKISGIIKSNEIPNAIYLIYNSYILIQLYDTVVYFYQLKDIEPTSPISFKLIIDENKAIVPIDINNNLATSMMLHLYNTYINTPMEHPLIAEQSNLQDDPEFSNLLSLKAGDGMKFFKLPNKELYSSSFLPVINGFPAMVKNDTISAKVYKDSIDGYSIVEYTLYKNKIKDNVKMYYRILNL